jgi:hypothetical protein
MRTWTRLAQGTAHCGYCNREVAIGEPLLVITAVGYADRKLRCATCAREPVPADLPALEPPTSSAVFTPIADVAERVALDARQRQCGDDA